MAVATVGFIGLGNMGNPMAGNLVKAGYRVLGFDVADTSRRLAAAAGIEVTDALQHVCEDATSVITMLPAGSDVVSVWSELLGRVPPGTLLVDCSTIDVASARQVHLLAEARGCLALDAPVSGGTGGAKAGTLTFMAGGSAEALARGRPMLEKMGRNILPCGPGGAGQAAKICNNMILGISMIAVSEAFVLADRLGLSRQALYDVAAVSSGQCWSLTTYCPVPGPVPTSPANTGYRPGFSVALMLKDLRLAQEAANAAGATTPLGAQAAQIYSLFASLGHGGDDFSAVINLLGAQADKGAIAT